MKRLIPVAILVLLLLVMAIYVPDWFGTSSPPRPVAPTPPEAEPGGVPPDVVPGSPPTATDGTDGSAASTVPPAGEDRTPKAPESHPAGTAPAGPGASPDKPAPAVRRNPRDPPPPGPSIGPKGRRPPFGPTGGWEKFPPAIPRGTAALKVRILDSAGTPIEGAEAYLGPPDIRGDAAVSYAHLRKLGKTGADGVLTAERLPSGAAALAGNLLGLLNGPRGLDAKSAIAITLVDDRTVEAELTLPLSLASMGSVTGTVLAPGGDPLRNAAVMLGFHRARTGKDGTFAIRHVPAGDHTLSITRSGYRPRGEQVRVEAGQAATLEVTLEFRESGSIALSGTVTGPTGEPVEKAIVYVIAYGAGSTGTVRSASTDEQGRYSMESLPDRLRKAKVRIQASRMGYHAANEIFESGLRAGEVDLRLPVKLTKLRLTVLDAASDEPLDRCRFEATEPGEDRPARSFSSRSDTGVYETWIAAGKYVFQVEAPDHEAHVAEVTVPEGGADLAYTARLVSEREASVEVSLTVVVTSTVSGDAVETAKIEVIDATSGEALSRLESRRPGGIFTLPAPSGRRRLRVTASGFETWETDVDLKPAEPERKVEAKLTPR